MILKFKIVSVDENEGSIVVRYYTDSMTEDDLANSFDEYGEIIRSEDGSPVRCRTDVNISLFDLNKTQNPSVDDIKNIILRIAPLEWFQLQEKMNDPEAKTNLLNLKSSIGNTYTFSSDDVLLERKNSGIQTEVPREEKLQALKNLISNPEILDILLNEINAIANTANTSI
jgi:hypothetical protein